MCVYMKACLVCMHTNMCTCVRTYVRMYVCTYVHIVCMHVYVCEHEMMLHSVVHTFLSHSWKVLNHVALLGMCCMNLYIVRL